jgi:hypothetical protein
MSRSTAILIVTSVLLANCGGGCNSNANPGANPAVDVAHGFLQLKRDMTKKEVAALMGSPTVKGPESEVPEEKAAKIIGGSLPVQLVSPPDFQASAPTGVSQESWTYSEPHNYLITLNFSNDQLVAATAIMVTPVLWAAEVPLPDSSDFEAKIAKLLEETEVQKCYSVLRRLQQFGPSARAVGPRVERLMTDNAEPAVQAAAAQTLMKIDPEGATGDRSRLLCEKLLFYLRVEDKGLNSLTKQWPETRFWLPDEGLHEALDSLAKLTVSPETVISVLTRDLDVLWADARFGNSRDFIAYEKVLHLLSQYGTKAQAAVPTLKKIKLEAQRALNGETSTYDSRDGADWFKSGDQQWVKELISSIDRTLGKIE